MGFRFVPTSMTLNYLECHNSPYFAFFRRIRQVLRPVITVVDDGPIMFEVLSPSSSLPLFAKTITHLAARSLCDS